mgnify:CR=1 FL=1|tara:strand:- start:453 stop:734 length:282 start_codon:yes stop_codon:yes gene_type:complete
MARYKNINGVVTELSAEEEAELDERAEASDLNLSDIRVRRDGTMTSCDWTQGPDSPLSDAKKAEWATYRQELRDYPAQSDKVSTLPDWPTPPE